MYLKLKRNLLKDISFFFFVCNQYVIQNVKDKTF